MTCRKHESDQKEAVRLVRRATVAHNKQNIVGAPLASYMIRNGSRFYFSHSFVFCPLTDLMKLLRNKPVECDAQRDRHGNFFFENQALHYLCRPKALENLSPKEFYENYSARFVNKKRKQDPEDLRFINDTGHYKHPSARVLKGNRGMGLCSQEAAEREEPLLVKVPQWQFLDTGSFGADLILSLIHI